MKKSALSGESFGSLFFKCLSEATSEWPYCRERCRVGLTKKPKLVLHGANPQRSETPHPRSYIVHVPFDLSVRFRTALVLTPYSFNRSAYRRRNVIERMFGRLKNWRRIATRYDRLAETYIATIALVAAVTSRP
ncbi:MAG: transposase [Rhizobiaceae bacterium]|nr:MAG: transposase [Rhizobiaceae bacterium]